MGLIRRKDPGQAWETESDSGGGDSPLLLTTVQVSSAEILNLHNVGKELLPAPGGRFYYIPFMVAVHYRFGTVTYTGNDGNLGLCVGFGTSIADIAVDNGSGSWLSSFATASSWRDLFAVSADAYAYGYGGAHYLERQTVWDAADIEDQPLTLCQEAAHPLVDGDGTLSVRLFYALIDGAPAT